MAGPLATWLRYQRNPWQALLVPYLPTNVDPRVTYSLLTSHLPTLCTLTCRPCAWHPESYTARLMHNVPVITIPFPCAFRFSWAVVKLWDGVVYLAEGRWCFLSPRHRLLVFIGSRFAVSFVFLGWPRLERTGPNGMDGMERNGTERIGRVGRRRMMDGWIGGWMADDGGLSYPYPYLPTYPYSWDFYLPITLHSLSFFLFLFFSFPHPRSI